MLELNVDDLLMIGGVYAAIVGIAFWMAMILWTYRDMKARSRDVVARLLVAVFVALLTFPGLLIYLFLRPRETLAESYERSLEEEALLQEIEEKPVCPTCSIRTEGSWQVCPSCHTRLKKGCINCGHLLELSWNICPFCAASQVSQERTTDWVYQQQRSAPPAPVPTQYEAPAAETLEYIDGDDY
jgi:RNA polymerase subunit RPABC4/transcription elongation factor Spt4